MSRCSARPGRGLAFAWIVWVAGVVGACTSGSDGPLSFRTGRIDPSTIVAVGDGYLAGATDGALFSEAQRRSIPALFARALGRAVFDQPLIGGNGFATDGSDGGRLTLVSAQPLVLSRMSRGGPAIDPALPTPYNNLAVPGALVSEALTAQSSASSIGGNVFYDLVLRDRGPVAAQVAALDASLVLLWLGTSDVLSFVAVGGEEALALGLPTPSGTFEIAYRALVDGLAAVTPDIVLFNVPDVTRLPVVTAVPNVVTNPATGDTITTARLVPVFDPATGEALIDPETGDTLRMQAQVPVPLIGPQGPLDEDDRVPLAALDLVRAGVGVPTAFGGTGQPLPGDAVLTAADIALVQDLVREYNAVIGRIAEERDLALVDVARFVETLEHERVISDGILLSNTFPEGQVVALDGGLFTPKGYGAVTNLLIDAVNRRFGGQIPHVRTADLPGVPLFGAGAVRVSSP